MTEKRFIIENERTVCDGFYGKCFVCSWKSDAEEMCRLLNELHEENIKIKKNCNRTHKENAELIDCVSDLGYSIIIRNGKVVLER